MILNVSIFRGQTSFGGRKCALVPLYIVRSPHQSFPSCRGSTPDTVVFLIVRRPPALFPQPTTTNTTTLRYGCHVPLSLKFYIFLELAAVASLKVGAEEEEEEEGRIWTQLGSTGSFLPAALLTQSSLSSILLLPLFYFSAGGGVFPPSYAPSMFA